MYTITKKAWVYAFQQAMEGNSIDKGPVPVLVHSGHTICVYMYEYIKIYMYMCIYVQAHGAAKSPTDHGRQLSRH